MLGRLPRRLRLPGGLAGERRAQNVSWVWRPLSWVLPDRVQLGRGLQLGMHVLRVGADTSECNFEFECAARVDAWNARQRGVATVHVAAVAVGWRRPCGRALYWRAAGLYRDERRSASSIPAAPPATPAKT